MSLINEALKKAQKQRTADSTPLPAIGGESAERIARRAKPAGFNTLLLYLGGGAAVLAVVVIAGVFLLRKNPAAPAPAPVAVAPAVKPPEPAIPAPAPVAASTITPTPAPAFVVPAATTPTPAKTEAPAPVVLAETPKLVVAPAPAPVAVALVPAEATPVPPKPEPAKPLLPGHLEPRAINYIESLHVAGIRASATDAKVLMNDRVYRIGSIVERELGLKLTGITANSLTFEDERGATYTRTF